MNNVLNKKNNKYINDNNNNNNTNNNNIRNNNYIRINYTKTRKKLFKNLHK